MLNTLLWVLPLLCPLLLVLHLLQDFSKIVIPASVLLLVGRAWRRCSSVGLTFLLSFKPAHHYNKIEQLKILKSCQGKLKPVSLHISQEIFWP